MGGGTAESHEVDREGREGEKSLDRLKVFFLFTVSAFFPFPFHLLLPYPLTFLFLFAHKGPCAICLRNSFRGLCGSFFERSKGVCVWEREMKRVREIGRTHRQLNSTQQCQIILVSVFDAVCHRKYQLSPTWLSL